MLTKSRSTRPDGYVAYTYTTKKGGRQVLFGSQRQVKERKDYGQTLIRCSIVDSPDGDGSCDLACLPKLPHVTHVGDSMYTPQANAWYLGEYGAGKGVPITVKVVTSL
jgi:hypothetical protein